MSLPLTSTASVGSVSAPLVGASVMSARPYIPGCSRRAFAASALRTGAVRAPARSRPVAPAGGAGGDNAPNRDDLAVERLLHRGQLHVPRAPLTHERQL